MKAKLLLMIALAVGAMAAHADGIRISDSRGRLSVSLNAGDNRAPMLVARDRNWRERERERERRLEWERRHKRCRW